jgi:hypothetical protein
MAEQLLDDTDVVSGFEQVCRKGMAERMTTDRLEDSCSQRRYPNGALWHCLMQVVPAPLLRSWVEETRHDTRTESPRAPDSESRRQLDESRSADVGFFRSPAVVVGSNRLAHLIEQLRRWRSDWWRGWYGFHGISGNHATSAEVQVVGC